MTKILNHINTYADIDAYNNDTNKDYPNVSYIQASDEVKWNKYDPDHIVAVYNVTSTETATTLLFSNTNITYQIIDGVRQDTVQNNYVFDTLGEHTVKYKLSGTSIGNYAFQHCTSLTSINIPDSVTSIGRNAFFGCSKLTSIWIGSGVTSIDNYAFNSCTSLTSINIPSGVTTIGLYAFQSCTSLTSITIPNGVISIGDNAFKDCSSLTSVVLPNSITRIESDTFYQCTSLASITIPNSVTYIGNYAFYYCSGLTSITVEATTPPSVFNNSFTYTNNCPIYVPAASVETYKTTGNWSNLASRIRSIPTT